MLSEGTQTPPFSLPAHTGTPPALADHRGHWLAPRSYPRACSEVRLTQARSLARMSAKPHELGATTLGVSFDPPSDNPRFAAQQGLDFPPPSDDTREIGQANDVARQPNEPFADAPPRVTDLIHPDGVIRPAYQVQGASGHGAALVANQRTLVGPGER